MGVQTPNPTVNADARRRGFARTAVAGYLVVGHLLSEDRYDRLGSWIQPVEATDWLNRSAGVS
jgi:hypothetical protein